MFNPDVQSLYSLKLETLESSFCFLRYNAEVVGHRPFSVAGPTAWNSLPDYSLIRRSVKTLLFIYFIYLFICKDHVIQYKISTKY